MKREAPPLTHFELFLMEERAVAAVEDPTEANLRALWVDHMRLVRDAAATLRARERTGLTEQRAYNRGLAWGALPNLVVLALYGHHRTPLSTGARWFFGALALAMVWMLWHARRRRA